MGDVSAEPSMEDILSSIKRIIAEEGENATASRARRVVRSAPPSVAPDPSSSIDEASDEAVLELRDAMPDEKLVDPLGDRAALLAAVVAPTPAADPILSPQAAEASRGALDTLSRMVVRSDESVGDNTLEGMVREMIRPMLREWLDARLPVLVETMVAREIARITGQSR